MSDLLDDEQLYDVAGSIYWNMEHTQRRRAVSRMKAIQANAIDVAAKIAAQHCDTCYKEIAKLSSKLMEESIRNS